MQRVRVGLTGLAAIFLLVMIAAAGIRPAHNVAPPKGQSETLAVLGVVPSSGVADASRSADSATPPAKAPGRN